MYRDLVFVVEDQKLSKDPSCGLWNPHCKGVMQTPKTIN